MICPYCNEEIKDSAQFCPVCGQKTNTTPQQASPQATQAPQSAPAQGSGMQFGQGQRLTPPGQAPQATQTPQSPPAQGSGMQFGQGQRLTPPGQAPQTTQAPQSPPAQGSGMQFSQGQRLTPPGQSTKTPPKNPPPQAVQAPAPVSHLSQKQRLAPPVQEIDESSSSKKWPIILGVGVLVCAVLGVIGMKMTATVPGLTQGTLPEMSTQVTVNALNAVTQYTHFANRSDITNEVVLAYFSQGTWEETQNNTVEYIGLLYGSQESIKLGYTVDSATGQGTLMEFSINNVSLGQDYESTNTFFTQLFQLACTGLDSGVSEISSFDLNELLFALVRTTEVSEGSYLYYCDLNDVLYPTNTWEMTPVTANSFYVDFKGFEHDSMVIFARLLVDTMDSTVNMVYFTENKVEYDLDGLVKWAEEACELFLHMMENGGQITTTPQMAPEVVTISDGDILDAYIEELQRYSEGFEENWSANQFQEVGLPETSSLYTVNSLFVSFVDFDNNGTPEMIVTGDEGIVLAIHTLSKNSTGYDCKILITDSMDQKISLGNGGYIAQTTVSAFDSTTTLYQVSGEELKSLDATNVTWVEDVYESMPIMALLPAQADSLEENEAESDQEAESEIVAEEETDSETTTEVVPEPEIEAETEHEADFEEESEVEIEINTT